MKRFFRFLNNPKHIEKIMKSIRLLSVLLFSFHALASAAPAGPITEKEGVARDSAGRTLYVFSKDKPGTSNCAGDCNKSWPAFIAKLGAKATEDLSLVAREGGEMQWAYRGQALYFFAGDRTAGDMNGEGMAGVWHAARMTAGASAAAPSKATASGYSY